MFCPTMMMGSNTSCKKLEEIHTTISNSDPDEIVEGSDNSAMSAKA